MTFNKSDNSTAILTELDSLPAAVHRPELPPILAGHETPQLRRQTESFYRSVAAMFEAWLKRRSSPNTKRAYRQDVINFVQFMEIPWPKPEDSGMLVGQDESWKLLQVTVPDVQAWRDYLQHERNAAPLTLNRRVSSLSGFYKFMREVAAEARLPITVPNPAHSQFIGRETQAPVKETEALSATRARQLVAMPGEESEIDYRDRAILKFYLYTGSRIGTGCRLTVADFIDDHENPRIKIQEKGRGKSKRTLGINVIAADTLRELIEKAELTSGPLFRPRSGPRGEMLANRAMKEWTMYKLIQGYLMRLPGALKEVEWPDGSKETQCLYTPHSLRATTATLLLDAGEDIRSVQDLLGHKHITVTQVYDKRRRGSKDSASHRLAF